MLGFPEFFFAEGVEDLDDSGAVGGYDVLIQIGKIPAELVRQQSRPMVVLPDAMKPTRYTPGVRLSFRIIEYFPSSIAAE